MLQVSAEAAGQTLKNLVFDTWRDGGCEGFADTAKSVGLVDFYLPFFPLERQHIQQLFDLKLGERVAAAHAEGLPEVSWHPSVVDFLTDKVSLSHKLTAWHRCTAGACACDLLVPMPSLKVTLTCGIVNNDAVIFCKI